MLQKNQTTIFNYGIEMIPTEWPYPRHLIVCCKTVEVHKRGKDMIIYYEIKPSID